MYIKAYEKLMQYKVPFHQKVLRLNYDIPLDMLQNLIDIIYEYLPKDKIYTCLDYFEESNQLVLNNEISSVSKIDNLNDCRTGNSMIKTAFFNKNLDYYMRVLVNNSDELSTNELLSGNIELYVKEDIIMKIYNRAKSCINAHILIEGAKNFLDEIYFY